jgi:hypothetical protein
LSRKGAVVRRSSVRGRSATDAACHQARTREGARARSEAFKNMDRHRGCGVGAWKNRRGEWSGRFAKRRRGRRTAQHPSDRRTLFVRLARAAHVTIVAAAPPPHRGSADGVGQGSVVFNGCVALPVPPPSPPRGRAGGVAHGGIAVDACVMIIAPTPSASAQAEAAPGRSSMTSKSVTDSLATLRRRLRSIRLQGCLVGQPPASFVCSRTPGTCRDTRRKGGCELHTDRRPTAHRRR